MAVAAVAGASAAARPAITSAYTKVDLDRCKLIEQVEEGSAATWRCTGYGGVALIVETGDERFDLDAGIPDEDQLWSSSFDSPPATVEWRLDRGRPFAIIYRLTVANPDRPKTSRLLVETVGRGRKPGCRVADIPGSTADANGAARRAAALILDRKARCMKP
jgi:hypothetical protein